MRLQESPPATEVNTVNEQTTEYFLLNKLGKTFPTLRETLFKLFAVDLRSLALTRIAVGSLLMIDLISRSRELRAFYSDDGLVPRNAIYESLPRAWYVSLHFLSGRAEIEALMFLLAGVFALMLILGYKTRLASFWSWLLLASLHARNPYVVHGGDSLMRMLSFWGIFVPWGARYSIESALNIARHNLPKAVFSIGTVALILQMPIVYFFTGLLKNGREWRHDFTAISYVLKAPDFAFRLGSGLASFPSVLKVATASTLVLEVGGALLLLSPFFTRTSRAVAIVGFLILQVGFLLTIKLGMFPVVSTVALLPFVPGSLWDGWSTRTRDLKLQSPRIYYDGDCDLCFKLVLLVRGLCSLPQATVSEAQSDPAIYAEMKLHNSWVVIGADERHFYKFPALIYLVQLSPMLWPVALILRRSPLISLGDAAYEALARNRGIFGPKVGWLRATPMRLKQPVILTLLCAVFLTYVVIDNMGSVSRSPIRIPTKLGILGQVLRIHQNWRMFAPAPPRSSRWDVVEGKLPDGTTLTLFEGNPVSAANPDNNAFLIKNYSWRTYWSWVRLDEEKDLRPYAARYYCDRWMKTHAEGETLSSVALLKVEQPIHLDEVDEQPQETILFDFRCSSAGPLN
jgi:predicted DCC family thiol-disulfide oxidoreductase YuxK